MRGGRDGHRGCVRDCDETRPGAAWMQCSAARQAAAGEAAGGIMAGFAIRVHFRNSIMALRATIYKADLNVADTDRHYYGTHGLTVARHPSETDERMMVRLVAFALHASEELAFTKGLSDTDEPDLWEKDLTGAVKLWIEVGQPEERRILRACRAEQVIVYCYGGSASKIWWDGVRNKLERARNLKIVNLPSEQSRALALAERTMQVNVNISDGIVYFSADKGEATIEPETWR